MIDDIDIYRAAKLLADRIGEGATDHAAKRMEELRAEGDVEGQMVWQQIMNAVEEILRGRGEGEPLH
jgi:hypothetical protein